MKLPDRYTPLRRSWGGGVVGLAEEVRSGRIRACDLVERSLHFVEEHNDALKAFVHLDPEGALTAAAAIDARVAAGDDPGPLAGVPFGVKDLDDCAGMPTAMGTMLLRGAPNAVLDAPHVQRLRGAGAIPIGKTATAELGIDSATSTPAFGTTRNPWDLTSTPGGSSGGSAAAVAAGLVPFATASDGGGSTRDPAALCGLVGLKPSHGRIPLARTSDTGCQGVLTTNVIDTARLLDVMAGPTTEDRTSLPAPNGSYEHLIESLDLRGLRAAWSLDLGYAVVDDEVGRICRTAADALVAAGGLEPVALEVNLPDPRPAWLPVACHDLYASVLPTGLWPTAIDALGPTTRLALEYGASRSAADLITARTKRRELETAMADVFRRVDILLTPMMAVPRFPATGHGRHQLNDPAPDPFGMPANLTWQPAISVPAGTTQQGMPVGLQIIAPRHRDDIALRLARVHEQLTQLSTMGQALS